MTKIKICGITRAEDAVLAATLGADFIGMIFVPESPRYLTAAQAAEIVRAVRAEAPSSPRFVGVFRNATPETLRETAAVAGLDVLQLHGAESDDDIRAAGFPVIKGIHVGATLPTTDAHPSAEWLLFDTLHERHSGGTGQRFDWQLLDAYRRTKPFLLAGGITPDNLADAIRTVRPDAIDLASGIESAPGIKDHQTLRILFERVRTP
jgi:phosphoribosylanthranilate isomerase